MSGVLSKNEFNDLIRDGVTIVDFNAPWCAPCRAQEPILSKIASQFEGRATVVNVGVDDHRDIARNLGIHSIPTLVIFKNGKEIQRFVGLRPESEISDALEGVLL
ncbi:MAG: thioredoxin [Desulfobacterales bacterium]|nr:thioredoxin [Desulfobacterales bacterium]